MARKPRGQRVVDAYFSRDHFDDRETCCPLIALPSDVMRGSDAVKGSYREILEKLVEIPVAWRPEPTAIPRAPPAATCSRRSALLWRFRCHLASHRYVPRYPP